MIVDESAALTASRFQSSSAGGDQVWLTVPVYPGHAGLGRGRVRTSSLRSRFVHGGVIMEKQGTVCPHCCQCSIETITLLGYSHFVMVLLHYSSFI